MPVCLISLGSNQGDRQATLDAAIAQLGQSPHITILARSAWRETAPIGGPPAQANFLNGALKIETSLEPHALLACLQQIEDHLGRQRAERWGPRTIDLDLLLYDQRVLSTPSLVLPHPRMAWRRFVLEPAAEVAGAMLHPTIGWTVDRLLAHLNSAPSYLAITGPIAAGKTQLAERLAASIPARLIVEQPDWDRLDAFYTDPASRGLAMELEFLHQRARLLNDLAQFREGEAPAEPQRRRAVAASRPARQEPRPPGIAKPYFAADAKKADGPRSCEPPSDDWTVSDFWFDQSAAFARAWLPAEQLPALLAEYEQLRRTVVRPKLVVLLDSPADELLARVCRRGRPCERRLTEEQLARIRRAVREQAAQPELGPVLRAGGDDAESIFAEVLAAVRGME